MPQYTWRAIDLEGKEHTGTQWAPHVQQLEHDLLEKNLGLMSAQREKLSWYEQLSAEDQSQFFQQLYLLVNAGLLVWQALEVLARYGSRLRRSFATELAQCIKHGSTFTQALGQFPTMSDALSRCLIQAGESSGSLAQALARLTTFLEAREQIRKKLRDAIRVPLLTFVFFCVIVLIIFLAIIPSFEQVFTVSNQEVSGSFSTLFAISQWLQQIGLLGLLGIGGSLWALRYFLCHWAPVQRGGHWVISHTPGIKNMYWSYTLAGYFQAVALLVHGGCTLCEALKMARAVTNNNYVLYRIDLFTEHVTGGLSVDQAFVDSFGSLVQPDISPLLAVGGQTGMLAVVFEQSARLLFEYTQVQLNRLTVIIQPVLMGVLGLMVAALLYTVYTPIIQLPQTLSASVNF